MKNTIKTLNHVAVITLLAITLSGCGATSSNRDTTPEQSKMVNDVANTFNLSKVIELVENSIDEAEASGLSQILTMPDGSIYVYSMYPNFSDAIAVVGTESNPNYVEIEKEEFALWGVKEVLTNLAFEDPSFYAIISNYPTVIKIKDSEIIIVDENSLIKEITIKENGTEMNIKVFYSPEVG
jgi:hypothetical protein